MTTLAGKIIAITGASSGIGEATAIHLAGRGATLVLGARRADRLAALAGRIAAAGGTAAAVTVDVTRRSDLEAMVETACTRFGRLDVLVNNAGIAPLSPLDALRIADWDAMIDVNLRGPLYGIAAALPVFRRQGAGHVVNVLSTAGPTLRPTMAVYAATKQAMRAVTEGLRLEAGDRLRVTAISPGFVRTDLATSMTDPDVARAIEARMGDIGLSPDAIARAIAFAVEQPPEVDVGEIVVRPTAQQ